MDLDKPYPNSITVFDCSPPNREDFQNVSYDNKDIYLEDFEENESKINAEVVVSEEIVNEYPSYEPDKGFDTGKSKIQRASRGYIAYNKERSKLVIYGKKDYAGTIRNILDISALSEVEMTPSMVSKAENKAKDLTSAKLLFPGNDIIRKISIQGNSLSEEDIESYSHDNYRLVSFIGSFKLNEELDISCRVTADSITIYVPSSKTQLEELNKLIFRLFSID